MGLPDHTEEQVTALVNAAKIELEENSYHAYYEMFFPPCQSS
jgi:hypothetical protein